MDTTYIAILKNTQQLVPLMKILRTASNKAKKVTNLHAWSCFLLNPRIPCSTECRYCVSFWQPVFIYIKNQT